MAHYDFIAAKNAKKFYNDRMKKVYRKVVEFARFRKVVVLYCNMTTKYSHVFLAWGLRCGYQSRLLTLQYYDLKVLDDFLIYVRANHSIIP